jgi:thiol:disulfide interchange protein
LGSLSGIWGISWLGVVGTLLSSPCFASNEPCNLEIYI